MSSTRSEKWEFSGSQGDRLAGLLELPAGEVKAVALFAHCFTCSKDSFAAARIARGLASRGFAVLRFDFTGLGASDGEFANTNFSSNVEDLVYAANALSERLKAPSLLVGHSLGGTAAIAAAGQLSSVKAVVTINAPHEPAHVERYLESATAEIEARGEATVRLAGRPFKIKKQFLEDISAQRIDQHLKQLDAALLVFHSPEDETVGIENAQQVYQAARHPKSFVSLDGADHLLHRRQDAEYVSEVLSAWVSRYVSLGDSRPEPLPKQVHVARARARELHQPSKLTLELQSGDDRFLADEPEQLGGADLGPAPYDYLLMALGACTTMTVRLYADHKGLPLEDVQVDLRHEKVDASECPDCQMKTGKIDKIEREIRLTGDLTDEQRTRLLEIANRCPVHRTLHAEVWEVSTLV
ncbi:MAG: alpha/beta fold hydrolase [Myxococcales bacterium]|nr:alpha/beta fold hydrolase [Myxococcales bacterium]